MLHNKLRRSGQDHEGPGFANALRDRLACGLAIIDDQQRLALLTGEAERILGLAAGQTLNASFEVLPVPLQEIIRDASSSGKPIQGCQIDLTVGRRGAITVHASAIPLQPGRKDAGVALVLNDMTATRRLEQQLQQLDRLANMGTLAAGMAHEIRNALVAGKTFIDLLLEKNRDTELTDIVRREIGRIDAIANRMLKYAGPARSAPKTVRLHEVLDHSLRLVQPQLESRLIALDRSFQAAPDLMNGDEYELQQAFVNLLLNALEAMGPNGTLTVATETLSAAAEPASLRETAKPPQLHITIKDTGVGIQPENMERLFEPFFTTKNTGTGLGLVITQRIIEDHYGAITVQSQPDRGTAFRIILPALDHAAERSGRARG
jgi:two-component system sensor histidine kinase HydH